MTAPSRFEFGGFLQDEWRATSRLNSEFWASAMTGEQGPAFGQQSGAARCFGHCDLSQCPNVGC